MDMTLPPLQHNVTKENLKVLMKELADIHNEFLAQEVKDIDDTTKH